MSCEQLARRPSVCLYAPLISSQHYSSGCLPSYTRSSSCAVAQAAGPQTCVRDEGGIAEHHVVSNDIR